MPKPAPLDRPVCPDPEGCCRELSRVWDALGITSFTGSSASEHVRALVEEVKRLRKLEALRQKALLEMLQAANDVAALKEARDAS